MFMVVCILEAGVQGALLVVASTVMRLEQIVAESEAFGRLSKRSRL